MRRLFSFLVAGLVSAVASQAAAANIDVRIERGGFFPPVVYVQNGDTITFTNHIGNTAHLHSANNSSSKWDWKVDSIAADASYVLTISDGMEMTVRGPCFASDAPPWWPEPSDLESEITDQIRSDGHDGLDWDDYWYRDDWGNWQHDTDGYWDDYWDNVEDAESDLCDGWNYYRYRTQLKFIYGTAPNG